jgi:hypothetical protein
MDSAACVMAQFLHGVSLGGMPEQDARETAAPHAAPATASYSMTAGSVTRLATTSNWRGCHAHDAVRHGRAVVRHQTVARVSLLWPSGLGGHSPRVAPNPVNRRTQHAPVSYSHLKNHRLINPFEETINETGLCHKNTRTGLPPKISPTLPESPMVVVFSGWVSDSCTVSDARAA